MSLKEMERIAEAARESGGRTLTQADFAYLMAFTPGVALKLLRVCAAAKEMVAGMDIQIGPAAMDANWPGVRAALAAIETHGK